MAVFVSLVAASNPMAGRGRLISLKLGNLRAELSPEVAFGSASLTISRSPFVETHPVSTMPAPVFADSILPAPVLVVEDEPLLQERLGALLSGLGYAPEALVFASSIAQAHRCLDAEPVALALVDLVLPDGSGLELIERMRAEDHGLGILVISAWSTEDAIMAALRAGATGY